MGNMKAHLWRPFFPGIFLASLVFAGAAVATAEEEETGVWIDRPDGTQLNLLVADQNFELHFYDEEDQPVDSDAAQAILHCTSRVVRSRETLALLPAEKEEKTILTSPRVIRPPYQFDILLVLNFDAEGKKPESHHVVFMQEAEPIDSPPPPPPAP